MDRHDNRDPAAPAADVLDLAVARGVLDGDAAQSTLAEVRRRLSEGLEPLDGLAAAGTLDDDTIARLARELGIDPRRAPVSRTPSGSPAAPPASDQDRYELLEFIGRGGMGDVYTARDPRLGRTVALKLLRRDDPQVVERFQREARMQARIDHDNVCPVFEVGEADGRPFIAMQLVVGGSLKDRRQELKTADVAAIAADVAEALHAAHRAGLLHRDVKPGNILLERDDEGGWRPFVVDFGIACETHTHDLTVSGMVLGTPAFSSPEQIRGENARMDARSDVYSLGATIYWALTGVPPVEGSYPEVVAHHESREPPTPRQHDPRIPRDLETIVLKCLEKAPERRYGSALEVAHDLRRFLAGEPVLARRAGPLYRIGRRIRRNPVLAATVAAATLLSIALTAVTIGTAVRSRRRAVVAGRLVEQVRDLENLARMSALLPVHDRRAEIETVRRSLDEIERETIAAGGLARGPGHYAVGRGLLVVGDHAGARRHLERAVSAGYDGPRVRFALGLALGKLYETRLRETQVVDEESLRTVLLDEIHRTLRDPAVDNLRVAGSLEVASPEYVGGLIAFYEGRHGDAIVLARQAAEASAWLYEARLLEGDVFLDQAALHRARGEHAEALVDLEAAGAAYSAARAVGRSDPAIAAADCARWGDTLELETRRGRAAGAAYDAGREACATAIAIDPERAASWERIAFLHWRWADHRNDGGEDPTPFVEQAVEAAERAVALDPDGTSAYRSLAGAHTVAALDRLARGEDPRPLLEAAAQSLERALQTRPSWVGAWDELGYVHDRAARYEMGVGDDPTRSLDRAAEAYRHAIEINPAYPNAHNNLGIALWRRAFDAMRRGYNPAPDLDAALASLDRALDLNPRYAYALANRGLVHRTWARWQLESDEDPMERVELAVRDLEESVGINPGIHWAHLERAGAELIAARWAMRAGRSPAEAFRHAEAAVRQAFAANPESAATHQTAAELHRWRARWAVDTGASPTPHVAAGRRAIAAALQVNPRHANSLVTGAAIELLAGDARSESRARDMLARALEINPSLEREVAAVRGG